MNRLTLTLVSAATGALVMYWLDPDVGRRRRARAVDYGHHLVKKGQHFARLASRDARQRSAGLAAEAQARLQSTPVDDTTLVARVRAHLGRLAAHPHALRVEVRGGLATVSGPVLTEEADRIVAGIRAVQGVRGVEDRLTRHDSPDHVSALQGGQRKTGPSRWEFAQSNWSPSARASASTVGAVLCTLGLLRRGPLATIAGVAGATLIARSIANIAVTDLLNGGRGVRVEKTIHINAPVAQVFDFWRHVEDFPRFMSHVQEVTGDLGGTTHWKVDGVGGPALEWDAQCTGMVENEVIGWSTLPDSPVQHSGVVSFEDCGDDTTRVHVTMRYQPPAGELGDRILRLVGFDPKRRMDDDLMRVKSFLETGRAAHDAAARMQQRSNAEPA
jgi:uncharacterized membrane protein